jgi:hypothetical protein
MELLQTRKHRRHARKIRHIRSQAHHVDVALSPVPVQSEPLATEVEGSVGDDMDGDESLRLSTTVQREAKDVSHSSLLLQQAPVAVEAAVEVGDVVGVAAAILDSADQPTSTDNNDNDADNDSDGTHSNDGTDSNDNDGHQDVSADTIAINTENADNIDTNPVDFPTEQAAVASVVATPSLPAVEPDVPSDMDGTSDGRAMEQGETSVEEPHEHDNSTIETMSRLQSTGDAELVAVHMLEALVQQPLPLSSTPLSTVGCPVVEVSRSEVEERQRELRYRLSRGEELELEVSVHNGFVIFCALLSCLAGWILSYLSTLIMWCADGCCLGTRAKMVPSKQLQQRPFDAV